MLLGLALGVIVLVLYQSIFSSSSTSSFVAEKEEKPVAHKAVKVAKSKPGPKPKNGVYRSKKFIHRIKNPKTGELATIPGGYRFVKLWIKEALVEEGLLDKVYKNHEVDDAVIAKVKIALNEFKVLKKYKV